jgi:hypothetical protein
VQERERVDRLTLACAVHRAAVRNTRAAGAVHRFGGTFTMALLVRLVLVVAAVFAAFAILTIVVKFVAFLMVLAALVLAAAFVFHFVRALARRLAV